MAESIDALQIEINAQATKANQAIDRLVGKIDKLTTSMSHLDGSRLAVLANGVQRLGTAMQTMNNVKTADFTRLAKNLQSLNNIDVSKLSNLSVNVKHIATSFSELSGMDKSAEQISLLANGIKQLGYSSAEKAITNIPLLASAMKKLMAELSTAPKVSQNLIDMTNALAKLARTGASSGKAANSLVNSLNRISKASKGVKINLLNAVNGISAIRKSILQAMGVAGGFYAVFNGIKEAINISSDLTEVQNVVDVTFGDFKNKIEDLSKVSIPELGMSELTAKQIASRFQAMGTAMGISQKGMSDMSVELTRLAGDMASFYNVEQDVVGEDLEAIFTGQTKPLRQYGLDLTEATLQEWAMKQGMDANINSMSQMEKTMLRYQYVMANTGAAQGDFLRTQDTWANQIRILQQNLQQLASVIGSSFINALKPLVKALNSAMTSIINFAKVVSNALGKIFGWKYEDASGGIANDYSDAAEAADDLADGTSKAANNAKKLKQQLQGIDELNVLTSDTDTGTGKGAGGTGETSEVPAVGGQWVTTDGMLTDYESQLDTLYKLGAHIGETLTNAMNSIDWDSVYQGAKNFGTGLASFLNGLISPELFGATGKTIAGALNTALYALNSFGTTFDWTDFGNSIASGINTFFKTFDFKNLADTINTWIRGALTSVTTLLKKTDFESIGNKIGEFLKELDVSGVVADLANAIWEAIKSAFELVKGLFEEAPLETALIAGFSLLKFTNIGSSIATKISQSLAKSLAEKIGVEIAADAGIATAISAGIVKSISTIKASSFGNAISGIATTLSAAMTTDLPVVFGAGTFAEIGTAIFGGVVGALAVAFGGWNLGKWLNENNIFGIGDLADKIVDDWGLGDVAVAIMNIFDDLPAFFADVWNNIKAPFIAVGTWFTQAFTSAVSGIKTAWAGITEFFSTVWSNIKTVFTNVKTWFGEKFSSAWSKIKEVFTVENVKTYFAKVWENIKSAFSNVSNWFKTTFSNAWKKVKEVFSSGGKVFDGIKDGILNGLKTVINALIKGINKVIKIPFNGINTALKKIKDVKILGNKPFYKLISTINVPQIPLMATGGFPEDGWFRASHGEMMGRFDNGQSVVANNNQITEGISVAVYKGNQQMISYMQQEIAELRTQNQLLTGILNKEFGISYNDVGKASQKYAREYANRTGKPAFV